MAIRGVLFTDLDGTLLDFETYRPSRAALEALDRLRAAGVRVFPVSSKTASEVRPLAEELRLEGPAVAEGGAVVMDGDGGERVVGLPRGRLVAVLERFRSEGVSARGMSEMTVEEVAARTGLSAGAAANAMDRRASEPFVLTSEDDSLPVERLQRLASGYGATVIRGGRFWHLMGDGVDKGQGVREVLRALDVADPVPTAAVGDAWNDIAMFDAVDRGYLLGHAVADRDVPPNVTRIPDLGPPGFALAIASLMEVWGRGMRT